MSKANPNVDLDSLSRPAARPEERSRAGAQPPRRRFWFLLVPVALLVGFTALFASSLTDWLGGALEVEVVRPVPVVGGAAPAAGQVVVQAAGWIEPDPFPIRVSALVSGVVRELFVQESDALQAGAAVAQLVDEDAALELREAEATLAGARAELARREAEREAAQASFDAALEVNERAATAQAELEGKRAEALHRAQAALAAEARLSADESELVVQRYLTDAGSAGPRAVELAEAALAQTRAEVESARADAELASAGARAAEAVLERARGDLELRIEEKLRVGAAEASASEARAKLDGAQVAVDAARLALERTTVRAPADGVVLERLAVPGAELSAASSGLVTMYDPRRLRARVEVPQGEIGKLAVGQAVRVESDTRPGRPYAGEVIRLVQLADINRVTLQVHVSITDADSLLRPEMLVQARFLGAGETGSGEASTHAAPVRIPAKLVVDGGAVWVLDAQGKTAVRRDVRVGDVEGDSVRILAGLNLTDKVIASQLERLEPGMRVRAHPAGREH